MRNNKSSLPGLMAGEQNFWCRMSQLISDHSTLIINLLHTYHSEAVYVYTCGGKKEEEEDNKENEYCRTLQATVKGQWEPVNKLACFLHCSSL